MEERARAGAETGIGVEVLQVVGDELSGRSHYGHVPDLGSLPADRHRHRARAADVGDVEVAELLQRAAVS